MLPGAITAIVAIAQLTQALPPAGETRYALVVGAHVGRSDETTLAYAGKDAKRVSEVLIELGGFQPDNVVTLQDPDAGRFREALGRLNLRVRSERAAGRSSLLMVYYSGHADQRALHLGESLLPWDELVTTVQGSAAELRLLVVDACRSGSATRVKGFHAEEPAALPPLPDPSAEGVAIFASATQGEDAQESDAIGASFFTHHLLAGLRGAADEDGDAAVTLEEVYRYARDQTVASTVTTRTGVQHPTYRYDFKGRQNVVLTSVTPSRSQGRAVLPGDGAFFFHERAADGPLAAEVHSRGRGTRVLLPSGRYVVRWRRPDRYYEGPLEVVAGKDAAVDPQKMRVFEYARLVRKGGGPGLAAGLLTFGTVGAAALERYGPGVGAGVALGVELEAIGIDAVLWYAQAVTTAGADQAGLAAIQRELGVLAGVRKAFDFGPLAVSIGLRGGAIFTRQDYGDPNEAARHTALPALEVPLRLDLALGGPFSLVAEGGVRVLGVEVQRDLDTTESKTVLVGWGRLGLGVGL